VQRLGKNDPIRNAAEQGQAVFACAYPGYIPADALKLLPRNYAERQFVAKIVDGELVELRAGRPIEIIHEMLSLGAASPEPETPEPETAEPATLER